MTPHIIWLAGVPHSTSVLYVVGLACHWTCGAVYKGCVVGPAEVDMTQHVVVWLDGMLCNTAVSAECSPLDPMLSRAVLWTCWRRQYTLHVVTLQVCDTLSRVQCRWNLLKGQLTISFRPCTDRLPEKKSRMRSFRRWHEMDALMRTICRCTQWENTPLLHLCCAPLDLLKGHAMLLDEGSVTIANTIVMYMQWRSCCSPPYWYVIGLSKLFISV